MSVRTCREIALDTKRRQKWAKSRNGTVVAAAADVLALKKPKCYFPCVLPQFDWPYRMRKGRGDEKDDKSHPQIGYMARSHLAETVRKKTSKIKMHCSHPESH